MVWFRKKKLDEKLAVSITDLLAKLRDGEATFAFTVGAGKIRKGKPEVTLTVEATNGAISWSAKKPNGKTVTGTDDKELLKLLGEFGDLITRKKVKGRRITWGEPSDTSLPNAFELALVSRLDKTQAALQALQDELFREGDSG